MLHFFLGVAVSAVVFSLGVLYYGRRALMRSRRNEERALEAERLVSQLAGGLAHEIRNPLSTMNLNLQLLAEDMRDDESPRARRAARRIELMKKEAERLSETLEDFLRFARADQLERQWCNVNQIVEEVLAFFTPQLRAHGIQVLKTFGDLPDSFVDPRLLKQALLNLLLNADQAMPNGGELFVRTSALKDCVQIEITDTGPGIPPDDLARIFNAYFSKRPGGSGLGLPTTRRIIEKHGGEITVHSELNKGTVFLIRLPLTDRLPDQPKPKAEATQ